ncbi:hypothetical protein [Cryptosporidium hominis TU502]|uniref:hypothetical protein n=1 Tax=Cryptosporidium hominis (strain TU502) TaxID=353151 RepID=UPI000045281C|nr:hypothetical protein [Cryptosporidium hominis TU502]
MCYLGSSTHGRCCCCIPLGISGTITSLILLASGIFTTCQFSQTPNQEIGGLTSSALFTGCHTFIILMLLLWSRRSRIRIFCNTI